VANELNGCTILVADDERYIQTIMSLKLREVGAKVILANDGCEALELARTNLPDLICTDYQMPLMNGLQLAQQLRANPLTGHIPILMLTTLSNRISPTELADTNIRALLGKPFSTRELLAKLEEVILETGIAA